MSMHSNNRKGILNNLFCNIRISSPYTIIIFCLYLYLRQNTAIQSLSSLPDFASPLSLSSLSLSLSLLISLSHSPLSLALSLSLLSLPLSLFSRLSLLLSSLYLSLRYCQFIERAICWCASLWQEPDALSSSQTYGREQHWHAGPFRCGTLAPYHPTAQ